MNEQKDVPIQPIAPPQFIEPARCNHNLQKFRDEGRGNRELLKCKTCFRIFEVFNGRKFTEIVEVEIKDKI